MYQIAVIFLRCFVNGGVAAYRRARRHPTYLAQTIYGVFLGFMLSYCFAFGLWPRLLRGLQSILTNPTVALTYCTAGGFLTADEIATKYVPGHAPRTCENPMDDPGVSLNLCRNASPSLNCAF